MHPLRKGDKGDAVKSWQYFLVGKGFTKVVADGKFGNITESATIEFQRRNGLIADGIVGNSTYTKAMILGFQLIEDADDDSQNGPNYPPNARFTRSK